MSSAEQRVEELTKAVIQDFENATERDIGYVENLVRKRDSESPEIELLSALRVSKGVPQLDGITAISERWLDASDSLEEADCSPNLRAVRSLLGKLYCRKLEDHIAPIVEAGKQAASRETDAGKRAAVLERAIDQVHEAIDDFGDLPGIDRIQARWQKKLVPLIIQARQTARDADKGAKAEARKKSREEAKGMCDGCGKEPRVLTTLESGQKVCQTCLRELRPPRPKHLATPKQMAHFREMDISVPDDLTKEQAKAINTVINDAYHYALDVWEAVRGKRVIHDDLIPGFDQRFQVHRFITMTYALDSALIMRVAAVQAERDRVATEYCKDAADKDGRGRAFRSGLKPPLLKNADYRRLVDLLAKHFKGFKRGGLLALLFGK